jgi:hypothetical protein
MLRLGEARKRWTHHSPGRAWHFTKASWTRAWVSTACLVSRDSMSCQLRTMYGCHHAHVADMAKQVVSSSVALAPSVLFGPVVDVVTRTVEAATLRAGPSAAAAALAGSTATLPGSGHACAADGDATELVHDVHMLKAELAGKHIAHVETKKRRCARPIRRRPLPPNTSWLS